MTLPTWSLGLLALALLAVGVWYFVSTRDGGQPEQQPPQAGATPSAAITSAAPSEPEEITYEVQAGDTLSTIAEQFDTTTEAIAQANDIADPNLITLGQVLVIPPETDTVTPQVSESPTG